MKDKTFHYEKGGDEMAIGIALTVLVLGLMFASRLSQGKSAKKKYIVWGTTIILIITPFFSCVVSILFSINQGDGFAEVGLMMLSLPLFFLIGVLTLLIGIFKKDNMNKIYLESKESSKVYLWGFLYFLLSHLII
ncbi:hypothetical protein P4606_21785 [Priestia aryabhattai]|uniref:hypothetical protein n=1 Tax=Priestia aryabhattai TaxID=412384 RepID=UPI002E1F0070|nr:hypothetical protein [Priestia aryabhattai]